MTTFTSSPRIIRMFNNPMSKRYMAIAAVGDKNPPRVRITLEFYYRKYRGPDGKRHQRSRRSIRIGLSRG